MVFRSFPSQRDVHADVGAQYWTRLSELNDDVRDELLRSGALVPFADDRIVQDAQRRHPSADAQSHAVGSTSKGFRAVVDGFLAGGGFDEYWLVKCSSRLMFFFVFVFCMNKQTRPCRFPLRSSRSRLSVKMRSRSLPRTALMRL